MTHQPEFDCPTPETHNWGCGCPTDVAAAIASCPGHEVDGPSPCRCPCEGCKHNCAAHQPAAVSAVAAPPTNQTAVSREAEAELYVLLRKAGEPRDEAQALIDRHRDEVLRRAALRRMADETATETQRPATHRWTFESCYDTSNDKWHGIGPTLQDHGAAVEEFEHRIRRNPQRKIRMVRETTTYTVEAEHEPAAGARQDGDQP